MKQEKGLPPLIQSVLIIAAFIILAAVVLIIVGSLGTRSRDTQRVAAISSLQNLLSLYATNNNGNYPTSLAELVPLYIPMLPLEPSSHSSAGYSYAALGSGTNCSSYHLGVALEDRTNMALRTDSDAQPGSTCTGSAPDFSGSSAAPAGQPCGTDLATATSTESCYDVTP